MAERKLGVAVAPTEERAVFDEVYAQYRAPLFNYICRLVGDREQAADLMQETFVKVYRSLGDLPEGGGRTPWLYRIATNTCYDALRRRRLIAWLPWTRAEEGGVEPAADDENVGDRYAVREGVQDALRLLPPSLRAPLLLHAVHGFSYADIAATLGTTEAAVKMRVSRARAAFRQAYNADDPEACP